MSIFVLFCFCFVFFNYFLVLILSHVCIQCLCRCVHSTCPTPASATAAPNKSTRLCLFLYCLTSSRTRVCRTNLSFLLCVYNLFSGFCFGFWFFCVSNFLCVFTYVFFVVSLSYSLLGFALYIAHRMYCTYTKLLLYQTFFHTPLLSSSFSIDSVFLSAIVTPFFF